MKRPILGLILALVGVGCGSQSSVPSPDLTGMGVIESRSSIEFSGIVLYDYEKGRSFDLYELPAEQKLTGSIVRYEVRSFRSYSPAGAPPRVEFTKFEVIPVEN